MVWASSLAARCTRTACSCNNGTRSSDFAACVPNHRILIKKKWNFQNGNSSIRRYASAFFATVPVVVDRHRWICFAWQQPQRTPPPKVKPADPIYDEYLQYQKQRSHSSQAMSNATECKKKQKINLAQSALKLHSYRTYIRMYTDINIHTRMYARIRELWPYQPILSVVINRMHFFQKYQLCYVPTIV